MFVTTPSWWDTVAVHGSPHVKPLTVNLPSAIAFTVVAGLMPGAACKPATVDLMGIRLPDAGGVEKQAEPGAVVRVFADGQVYLDGEKFDPRTAEGGERLNHLLGKIAGEMEKARLYGTGADLIPDETLLLLADSEAPFGSVRVVLRESCANLIWRARIGVESDRVVPLDLPRDVGLLCGNLLPPSPLLWISGDNLILTLTTFAPKKPNERRVPWRGAYYEAERAGELSRAFWYPWFEEESTTMRSGHDDLVDLIRPTLPPKNPRVVLGADSRARWGTVVRAIRELESETIECVLMFSESSLAAYAPR